MDAPPEVMPQQRRLLITLGVVTALCEWSAAIAGHYATGTAKTLLGGAALFLALFLFFLSMMRPGGLGRRSFWANVRACTVIHGAMFFGFFLFMFELPTGITLGLLATPMIGLCVGFNQTWPIISRFPK